ncbi:MAG TPA: transcription-repair coupling factor [Spirochaetota bacterium]|nr:transcription-repair coupling factor [Spirochaetota bacterium]
MTLKEYLLNFFSDSLEFNQILDFLKEKKVVRVKSLSGSSSTLVIANLFKKINKTIIYLVKDDEEAENTIYDFESYGIEKCYHFPSIDITPYQSAIVSDKINSKRLDVLKKIINNEKCIIITSVYALFFHIVPKKNLLPYIIRLKKDDKIDIEKLKKMLLEAGYYRVNNVTLPGEFAQRGDIFDIYYSSFKNPVRIDFFDDTIEKIKSFNPITQKSEEEINEIIIPPHKEIVYDENIAKTAIEKLKKIEGGEEEKERIIEKIANFIPFDGEQFYLSLFYEKSSLISYFDEVTLFVNDIKLIENSLKNLENEFEENFHITAYHKIPKIPKENMLFTREEIYELATNIIELTYFEDIYYKSDIDFDFKAIPAYSGNLELFKNDVKKFLSELNYKIMVFAINEIQSERLTQIFKEFNPVDDRFDFQDNGFSIYPLTLQYGFISEKKKVIFLNDYEIFGKRSKISKHFYTKRTEVIDDLMDLNPGDYVVHIYHGIGQFLGIERVKTSESEKDYIAIMYADNDKIFIPIEQLNFLNKYISSGFAKPKLDKIGSKVWARTKESVKQSVRELAEDLIKIYAERLNKKGFAFAPDTPWQKEFEARFPYEETHDQLITIEEVKRDMESPKIMDRLICGDVGFGKTEVAIRASFKAVMSGKQVAVLVPTTLLADQHYETFKERMRDYPINIEMLSRFKTDSEQNQIIKKMSKGEIDIIIGTHRLLSNDVKFKNLGLLIIDEEHKFGVKQKEFLKKLRLNVDTISMTATPIPRTLHMSLANIRDISIINTPPKERESIETYVMEFNEEILKDAIKRELDRSGQVYFLYNRVKTINEMKKYLQSLFPKAKITVTHGQMDEDELEDIIHRFIHYEYDILLTTTIIESGIDIPRANTIIIDRADRFGLSQLYQLRGRVGRSNIKSYAYLFYEKDGVLTEEAMKRLRVISEYTDLGSGFKIALKDLEIRGAGNIFGPEQSGNILAVGFHLYCKLLREAVREINKEKKILPENEIETSRDVYLDLEYKGYIPDSYISDPKQKIEYYKKIAQADTEEELEDIYLSLIDRFGNMPEEVKNLLYISRIKILCKKIGITEIIDKKEKIEIKFQELNEINIEKLLTLVAESKGDIYLLGSKPNSIFIKKKRYDLSLNEKLEYIKEILQNLF